MEKVVLRRFDMPWLPTLALLIFAVCFVAYVYWTYQKKNKPLYEEAETLPLSDGDKYE